MVDNPQVISQSASFVHKVLQELQKRSASTLQLKDKAQHVVDYHLQKLASTYTGAAYVLSTQKDAKLDVGAPSIENLAREFTLAKLKEHNYKNINDVPYNIRKEWLLEFCQHLENTPSFTYNQTPHPTLTVAPLTMDIEANLVDFLHQQMHGLLSGAAMQDLDDNITPEEFANKLETLHPEVYKGALARIDSYATVVNIPPEKGFTITNEMAMGVRQSRHIYHSVSQDTVGLARIAQNIFGIDINKHPDAREAVVAASSSSTRNQAWSPADNDDKPQMWYKTLREGILMGTRAINMQYIEDLAAIAIQLREGSHEREKVEQTIRDLFETVKDYYLSNDTPESAYGGGEDLGRKFDEFCDRLERDSQDRWIEVPLNPIIDDFGSTKKVFVPAKHPPELAKLIANLRQDYIDHEETKPMSVEKFAGRLRDIAGLDNVRNVKQNDIYGDTSPLAAIDALRVKQNTYGNISQRITHRQNRGVYADGTEHILELLNKEFGDRLPAKLTSSKDVIELLFDPQRGYKNDELANDIRTYIQTSLRRKKRGIERIYDEFDNGTRTGLSPKELKEEYATWSMLWITQECIYSEGRVERQLNAENSSAEDLQNIMMYQLLMTKNGNPPLPEHLPELDPLVEYTDDIRAFPKILNDALSDEHFKAYNGMRSKAKPPSHLKRVDKDNSGQTKFASVREFYAERARFNGVELEDYLIYAETVLQKYRSDEFDINSILDLTLEQAMVIMGAGSDSNKSSGAGFGPEYATAMEDAIIIGASHGVMCTEKKGNGTAAHRDQVKQAIIQTRQGLQMQETEAAVAAQRDQIRVVHAAAIMGLEVVTNAIRRVASLVNLGNRLNFRDKLSPQEQEIFKQNSQQRVASYRELYTSSEFSTAIETLKLKALAVYKYAARPPVRLGSGTGVFGTRAIGYGLLMEAHFNQPHLQAAASHHTLFADNMGRITTPERRLNAAKYYLKSPTAQDMVNRSLDRIVGFHPDNGWKNVSYSTGINEITRAVDDKGVVRITLTANDGETKTFSAGKLSKLTKAEKQELADFIEQCTHPDHVGKKPSTSDIVDTIVASARLDWESTKTRRALNQMFSDLAETRHGAAEFVEAEYTNRKGEKLKGKGLKPKTPDLLTLEQLDDTQLLIENVTKLNPELGRELKELYEFERSANQGVTEFNQRLHRDEVINRLFNKPAVLKGNISDEDRDKIIDEYFKAYPDHHVHTEITESLPKAQHYPSQAIAQAQVEAGNAERLARMQARRQRLFDKTTFTRVQEVEPYQPAVPEAIVSGDVDVMHGIGSRGQYTGSHAYIG